MSGAGSEAGKMVERAAVSAGGSILLTMSGPRRDRLLQKFVGRGDALCSMVGVEACTSGGRGAAWGGICDGRGCRFPFSN